MTQASVPVIDQPRVRAPRQTRAARYFYTGASAVLIAASVIGFSRFYFEGLAFPGRPIAPPIKAIVISHAVLMSLWLVVLAAQSWMIAAGNRKLHRRVGPIAAVLAGVIVIEGLVLSVRATQVTPPDAVILGFTRLPFMAIPFFTVLIFAGFTATGVIYRRKPRVHRVAMLLGTLVTMSASLSRIMPLNELYLGTVWDRIFGPFSWTLALGLVFLIVRSAFTRRFEKAFAIGLLVLAACCCLSIQCAHTDAWVAFASFLAD